ncbi:hypothetical protein Tco_1128025 [Tanacetum coccineum]
MFPPLTGCDRLVMSTPAYVDSETITPADRAQSSQVPVSLPDVMSTLAYVDSETITQADGAQSARLPVPLPDDPYVAVRHASEEFDAFEPSGTRTDSSHSSALSDSTTPLSSDHLFTHVSPTPTPTRASFHRRIARITVRAQPAMSLGHSARVAEAMALSDSAFRDELGDEDTNEDGEDESLDADDKRERSDDEDYGLDDEGRGLEGERLSLEEEEEDAVPEGQQQAVPVVSIIASEPLGLGYEALRRRELAVGEDQPTLTTWVDPKDDRVYIDILIYPPVSRVQTPPSPEWSFGSLPISPSSPVVPSPIASLVATPTATISVDDNIDRDVKELYTRSVVVRDEIFSQRYRFRSLEHEQERTTMTFGALWRPVLALEAWAGQTDAQRSAL